MTFDAPRSRFSVGTFLKALLPALIATLLFVFIFTRASSKAKPVESHGMLRVTLSQKDASFQPIPRSAGGATGVVWYAPTGPSLRFQLRAFGLVPAKRYALEMQVDSAIYTVASYAPDARGELAVDTTLTEFREGICVGANYDQPTPAKGAHTIKFWVKKDGSPPTGTMPGVAAGAPGAGLSCHGNGDSDYKYVLLENETANFTGH
jgi:hypothetical protein